MSAESPALSLEIATGRGTRLLGTSGRGDAAWQQGGKCAVHGGGIGRDVPLGLRATGTVARVFDWYTLGNS